MSMTFQLATNLAEYGRLTVFDDVRQYNRYRPFDSYDDIGLQISAPDLRFPRPITEVGRIP
ncbi:MAG: hypothetical protein ACLVJB_02160 [Christensenellales bacterium]